MPDPRPRAERPLPERLALGDASRLLGVDPDTLRRWADEGRVPAFTTPGGHRRFERRALERLIAARRTGPAGGLAGLGASPDRLSAAYRRRYGEHHGTPDPRLVVPESERESYRDIGRRLVDALIRHIDEAGPGRALAERDARRPRRADGRAARRSRRGARRRRLDVRRGTPPVPRRARRGRAPPRRGGRADRRALRRRRRASSTGSSSPSWRPTTSRRASWRPRAIAGRAASRRPGRRAQPGTRRQAGDAAVTGGWRPGARRPPPHLGDDGAPDLDDAAGRDAGATRPTGAG